MCAECAASDVDAFDADFVKVAAVPFAQGVLNREAVATAGDERAGDVVKARIAGEEGRDEAQISDKDAAFFEGVGNQAAGANCAGGGVEDDVALVNLRESGGGEGEDDED